MNRLNLLSFCVVLLAAQGQTRQPQGDIAPLDRSVELHALRGTTTEAITMLLTQASLSGGIISVRKTCGEDNPHVFTIDHTTVREGLNYVSTIDSSRKWEFKDGSILVGKDLLRETLLDTKISAVDVSSDDSLSLSTQTLLQTDEVQNGIRRLGLSEQTPAIGFSKVSSTPSASQPAQPRVVKQLRDVTLRDALSLIASSKGRAVWHYEQLRCGHKSFRISWIVQ